MPAASRPEQGAFQLQEASLGRADSRQSVPGAMETQGSEACVLRGQKEEGPRALLSGPLREACHLPLDLMATQERRRRGCSTELQVSKSEPMLPQGPR